MLRLLCLRASLECVKLLSCASFPSFLSLSPTPARCPLEVGATLSLSETMSQAEAEEAQQPILVFIFWDHSNIYIEAHNIAEETECEELGDDVGRRVRIDFSHMLTLAHENRRVAKAVAARSVPPEMHAVWQKLEKARVATEIVDRSLMEGSKHNGSRSLPAAGNVAGRLAGEQRS